MAQAPRPRHWWRRWPGVLLRWTVVIPLLVYGLYVGAMYALQDALMFPGPPITEQELSAWAERTGVRELRVPTSDGGHIYGWHVEGRGERVVAYFHGNGGTVVGARDLARLVGQNWDVVAFSYHGYPGGTGQTSEQTLALDAQAAWAHLTGPLGFAPERIVLHGRSLGGSVATMAAMDRMPAGLVLESTFRSMAEVAGDQHPLAPVSLLIKHPLRTDRRLPGLAASVPVLILHGTDDDLIPVRHGRGLASLRPTATYVERAGYGHNDPLVFSDETAQRAYLDFLARAVP